MTKYADAGLSFINWATQLHNLLRVTLKDCLMQGPVILVALPSLKALVKASEHRTLQKMKPLGYWWPVDGNREVITEGIRY